MRQVLVLAIVVCLAGSALAQNAASNKAFFAAGTDDVTLAAVSADPGEVPVLIANQAIKTSSVGALQASVSAECALLTYTTVTATSGGGKQIAGSRAYVKMWVEVDGKKAMTPEKVVYCDRTQVVGLDVTSKCSLTGVTGGSCTVTDTIVLDLFQATKNANSFNFFIGPLSPTIHDVVVKAEGGIECTANGAPITCPSSTLTNYYNAKTTAAIGKRTLILEEVNNWGVSK